MAKKGKGGGGIGLLLAGTVAFGAALLFGRKDDTQPPPDEGGLKALGGFTVT